jgi:hypothetical protein
MTTALNLVDVFITYRTLSVRGPSFQFQLEAPQRRQLPVSPLGRRGASRGIRALTIADILLMLADNQAL